MKQINKYQQDWDEPINENFAMFSNGQFSDNVIYLNGAKRKDSSPIWHCGYSLGVVKLFVVQGTIILPDLAAGQTIDVFNIPAITSKIQSIQVYYSGPDRGVKLNNDESVPGTFSASNTTSDTNKSLVMNFKLLAICDYQKEAQS